MRSILGLTLCMAAAAAPPALRQQVSLNGAWDEGGTVPVYEGIRNFDQARYRRTVSVPDEWQGKRVHIEFENVAFIADVYIDGEHATTHVGAWNPFYVDVTKWARPGASFELRVDVKGPRHPPIVDAAGAPLWPVGGWLQASVGGMAGDVWLRAYGPAHIEDAHIRTSYRNRTIAVDYTLVNTLDRPQTVTIHTSAVLAAGGGVPKKFKPVPVTLAAGERRSVTLTEPWPNPELWFPDSPVLYHLRTKLTRAGRIVDEETRRFGFREIWVEGNQFRFNGVRTNLFGDYQVFGDTWYTQPVIHKPENWPATVDKIKAMNIRVLRWHHNPVPQYLLDVTDEKGLLICDEAANYARTYHMKTDKAAYLENTHRWIGPWIKADRNHPSVYMWNATNEMSYNFAGAFDPRELRRLGDTIRKFDSTRPVGYDGDHVVDDALIDYHYPELYNHEPVGSIYGWGYMVQSRPTGMGETLHTRSPLKEVQYAVERNTWWLGIWTRGLRYTNWTNVKPACYWFAEKDGFKGARAENLRNAYAPVALFDKDYDDLGLSPYVTGLKPGGKLPPIQGGIRANRTLVLYNDEFRDTSVTAEVELLLEGKPFAKVSRTFTVPLGRHIDIPVSFNVPPATGRAFTMVLRTSKAGRRTFEESRHFTVAGHRSPEPGTPWIRFGR
jgi:hypothetical protein